MAVALHVRSRIRRAPFFTCKPTKMSTCIMHLLLMFVLVASVITCVSFLGSHCSTTAQMQAATPDDCLTVVLLPFNCYSKASFSANGLPLSGLRKTLALSLILLCAALFLLNEGLRLVLSAVLHCKSLRRWAYRVPVRLYILYLSIQLKCLQLDLWILRTLYRKESRQGAAARFCSRLLASRVVRVCMVPVRWVFTYSMRMLCWVGLGVATSAQWCSSRCSRLFVWYKRAQRSRRRTHSRNTAAGSSRGGKRSSLHGANITAGTSSSSSSNGAVQLEEVSSGSLCALRPVGAAAASSSSSSFSSSDSDAEADADSISDLLALLPASKGKSAQCRRAAVQGKQRGHTTGVSFPSVAPATTTRCGAAAPFNVIAGCTQRAAPPGSILTGHLAAAAAEPGDAVLHSNITKSSGSKPQVKASETTTHSCCTSSSTTTDIITASTTGNGSSDACRMAGDALPACKPLLHLSATSAQSTLPNRPPYANSSSLQTHGARLTAGGMTPGDATAGSTTGAVLATTDFSGTAQMPAASSLQWSSKGPATAPATSTAAAAAAATASARLADFGTSLSAPTGTQQAYQPLLFAQPAGTASTDTWGTATAAVPAVSNGVAVPAAVVDCSVAVVGAAASGEIVEEHNDDDEQLCVVCWVGRRTVALVHGDDAHLCLCTSCSQLYDHQARGCPMCRRPVEMLLPVYS